MSRSPRQLCVAALAEWHRGKLFADEILDGSALSAISSPAAIARWLREAFYGTMRHLSQIDFLIGRLREGELDAEDSSHLEAWPLPALHMRAPSHAVGQ
jgi:hypothetical protein